MPACQMHRGHCLQITDDSEMALCLARGLRTATPPAFPAAAVADQYVNWAEGPPPPFDMGALTACAAAPISREAASERQCQDEPRDAPAASQP